MALNLTVGQLDSFDRYGEELKKWNRKINLTAITSDEEIALKHFVDSLAVAPYLRADDALLDIGSGAGFPSLPLKIVMPGLKVTSIDAVEKKIIFQRNVARLLGLADFRALHGRAEQLQPEEGNRFDVVVSRAFSDIPTFARMALPLLEKNGAIIAMKGKEGSNEADAAEKFLRELRLAVTAVEIFNLPAASDTRSLVFIGRIGEKTAKSS
ncbi:16S rRNA (guanine(527)-N(7))-methyltransferase RsmG [Geotalea sp. SG265]|uniref:16S rRNA (guanine(527)-N(7))-methyltransferase RsmG n=1 Tax=Geotalea sp. SG265 TaxID=2922867 RepID=UPI00325FCC5F